MDLALGIRRCSSVVQGEAQVDVVSSVPPPLPEQIREHMFDKVVTPSDVGKLNRLVIPKHHAEKHFPLDAEANDKGLLLSFEDRTGKPWRFRYSYWGSSQSYVITKGWSRFVKEKGLGAGDTVSFARGAGEATRHCLYIDWKRRRPTRDPPQMLLPTPWAGVGQLFWYKFPAAEAPEVGTRQVVDAGSGLMIPMVLNSVPLVHGQAGVKRVRLFGVNLDCPESGGASSSSTSMRKVKPSPVDLY